MLDDDYPSIRPRERIEKDNLFFKKFQKIDLNFKKLETMLEKNFLQMQKILLQEKSILQEEKNIKKGMRTLEKDDEEVVKLERKRIDEEIKSAQSREKRLATEVKKLSTEEDSIQLLITQRREEDTWFMLIMHDCPHKRMEKNHLICAILSKKKNKYCNFTNCPRKKELKKYL